MLSKAAKLNFNRLTKLEPSTGKQEIAFVIAVLGYRVSSSQPQNRESLFPFKVIKLSPTWMAFNRKEPMWRGNKEVHFANMSISVCIR